MAYFDWRERAEFGKKWERQKKAFTEAGMTEEAIDEIYRFDMEVFRGERQYRLHNCTLAGFEDDMEDSDIRSPLMEKYLEKMSVQMQVSYRKEGRYGWIDEMDSEWLVKYRQAAGS